MGGNRCGSATAGCRRWTSGRWDSAQFVRLRATLFEALRVSFDSGIPWRACRTNDRGDGMVVVVPQRLPAHRLAYPLPDRLSAQLRSRPAIGETDLLHRDGVWLLHAVVDSPEASLREPVNGFPGVDLGIVNIATTSDGDRFCGSRLNRYRKRRQRIRKRLQARKTSSARRLLKKRRRKEARFAADVNHHISKNIVAEAERTGRGIAVEELTGIRVRVRLRKPQRATLHSWAFAQLGQFLTYKAQQAGVVVQVDPAYTTSTNATAAVRRSSSVAGVTSLGTPTTTQHTTSRLAVSCAGAKSCAQTQRPSWQPARTAAASSFLQGRVHDERP